MMLTRRGLLAIGLGAVTAGAGLAQKARGGDSVLRVRPHQPTTSVAPGEHALDLGGDRDGLLIVPQQYRPDKAAPLALMLHGAGGHARRLASLLSMANSLGVVLLVPESRGTTWDAIRGSIRARRGLHQPGARPDVHALRGGSPKARHRRLLRRRDLRPVARARQRQPLHARDGVLAGLHRCPPAVRKPRIFISHGRSDTILPIDVTSRRIVPELEDAGYAVTYKEFDGPHAVPEAGRAGRVQVVHALNPD